MKPIRSAAVQFQHAPGDKSANLQMVEKFVEQAHHAGVQMICFPECCLSGYWHLRRLFRQQLTDLAEPVFEGQCCQRLMALSRRSGITIGAGLLEKTSEGDLYNTYVVAMPDGRFARHRKLHAFINPHVQSGSQFTVFDDPHGVRVGVLICYDNNLGENVRITALAGAEVLLAPHQTGGCHTASPRCMGVIDRRLWDQREANPEAIEAEFRGEKGRQWLLRWLPARAHDNGLFLVFSNGVGLDDDEVRTGNAMILDPYGAILKETWRAADEMVVADLDPSLLEKCTGRRWIRTRRPELYQPLTVPTGCEEETRKVRFEHVSA